MKTNTKTSLLLLLTTAAVLLAHATTLAQPNTWIDPRHPSVAWLQEWGYMTGTGLPCKPYRGEEFGRGIIPVGDVNGDAIADFILERSRCDTLFGGVARANELLLYYGTKGQLPASSSGIRIGPADIGSQTAFLAAGDWNGDHLIDLAIRQHIIGDTSEGNTQKLDTRSLVIYWHTPSGYSSDDTTRLTGGAAIWGGLNQATSRDLDGDDLHDLIVWHWDGAGLTNGVIVPIPRFFIYRGHKNLRWGEQGIPRSADMTWWNAPATNELSSQIMDYDCDGSLDIAMIEQRGDRVVRVLYGGLRGTLPDTTSLETIDLAAVQGQYALFQDVTGDKVPDLIVRGGDFEQGRIRIFAGAPGQRLTELYGNGNDSADRANHRFPLRPWAQILSPNALHEGWFGWDYGLFDLGDINEDGTSEIVAFSHPFILCYTTGNTLDSLIDIMFQPADGPWNSTLCRVGDVDGSGKPSYALTFSGRVHFLKAPPKDDIPTYGGRIRSLPHPRDFRCDKASAVQQPPPIPDNLDLSQQGGALPAHHYHR